MKKVLVTGSDGQMGQSMKMLEKENPELNFLFLNRQSLDLVNDEINAVLADFKPDFVLNFAAYTAVDKAESEKDMAHAVNTTACKRLAQACKSNNAILIHVSTDYVYHNELNRPLKENDPCTPKSVYGKTKLEGELAILKEHPDSVILRCSWVYGPCGQNFMKTMIRLMAERDQLSIVQDQIGTPGYSLDLCRGIIDIIHHSELSKNFGVYNLSNSGVASWFDFALNIARIGKYDLNILPIPSSEYPTPAQRPHYSVMDTSKIKNNLGIQLRPWQEALEEAMLMNN